MNGSRQWKDRPLLKAYAREKLQGKLLACFAACLLPRLITLVMRLAPSNLGLVYFLLADTYVIGVSVPMSLLALAAAVFVTDPMQVRLAGYFLALKADGKKAPSPGTICDCFGEDYWHNVRGMLLRGVYTTLPSTVFFALSLLTPGAVARQTVQGYDCICLDPSLPLMALGLLAWAYTYVTSIFMRPILAQDLGATAREALRRSRNLVRGRLWEMIVLGLSFLPWLLVTATTIVPALFLLPYAEGTLMEYYIAMTDPVPHHLDGGPEDEDAA